MRDQQGLSAFMVAIGIAGERWCADERLDLEILSIAVSGQTGRYIDGTGTATAAIGGQPAIKFGIRA